MTGQGAKVRLFYGIDEEKKRNGRNITFLPIPAHAERNGRIPVGGYDGCGADMVRIPYGWRAYGQKQVLLCKQIVRFYFTLYIAAIQILVAKNSKKIAILRR